MHRMMMLVLSRRLDKYDTFRTGLLELDSGAVTPATPGARQPTPGLSRSGLAHRAECDRRGTKRACSASRHGVGGKMLVQDLA